MIISAHDSQLDEVSRIMVDANVAIAYFDSRHKFHPVVKKRVQELFINGASFYYSQPVFLELKNYWRRKLISECIDQHVRLGKRLYNKFQKLYEHFRDKNRGELLVEYQLKELRETLESVSGGKGVELWFLLCKQAMESQFGKLDELLQSTNFKYAKFNDDDVFPDRLRSQWPKWEAADSLIEKFGLASNDAAILNMVKGGRQIEAFVSNDGDLLFAIAKGAISSTILATTFLDRSPYL